MDSWHFNTVTLQRNTLTENQRAIENMTIIQTFLALALGFWPQHTAPSVLRTASS